MHGQENVKKKLYYLLVVKFVCVTLLRGRCTPIRYYFKHLVVHV